MTHYLKYIRSNRQLRLLAPPCVYKAPARLGSSGASINNYDIVIVGGGILGTATARELKLKHKKLKMAVVEKENNIGMHQSSHNSGVVHAGIYYKPGSLKAKLCVEGMQLMYQYCDAKRIPYKKIGKLIVATSPLEQERLQDLIKRAEANNVKDFKVLKGQKEINTIEPHCQGIEAIHSPHTGIVDYKVVAESFGEDFKTEGGQIYLNFQVNGFQLSDDSNFPISIESKDRKIINAKYVFTCTGLHSDVVSAMSGCEPNPRIVSVRGEYLLLNSTKNHLVKGNIYPVPDPKFPFLGVHFTPRMDGSVWLGPNAVLAFKREGYSWFDVNVKEFAGTLFYPGLTRLLLKHTNFLMGEVFRSIFLNLQMKSIQRYIPEITMKDISRGPSGVRAQALDISGNMIEDFHFDKGEGKLGERILHCRNAPSPGATSSMAIAKMMANKLDEEFSLSQSA